jgi:hypothetical protein
MDKDCLILKRDSQGFALMWLVSLNARQQFFF